MRAGGQQSWWLTDQSINPSIKEVELLCWPSQTRSVLLRLGVKFKGAVSKKNPNCHTIRNLFIYLFKGGQSLISQSGVSNFTLKTTNNNKRLFAAYFCFNQSPTMVFPAFVCLSYFRDFLFWHANIKWEEFSSVSVGLPGVQCGATATKINVNTETESRADCYQ